MNIARICKVAVLAAAAWPVAAIAQETGSQCAEAVPPPGEFAAWSSPAPLPSGSADLTIGTPARVTLQPRDTVAFAATPGRAGDAASFAGRFTLAVGQGGTYRIALAAGAWVDVVRDGVAIASAAHGHGPECSGIRKIVDFPLEPGSYTVQIAASPVRETVVMVARKP
jgi:hypothetical protein